ncbi:inverse autotransporter beta domain-containing protein [Simkania sp.]|uniref:inverse autotransporter beta domain-containing protein n=1 Tax=Simkania sp. TaxID=34094 RepID=UPI003B52BD3A
MWRLVFLLFFPLLAFSHEGIPPSYSFLKHREHKGVGYDTGYTSVDLMASPIDFPQFYPFLNVRGHVFNDGRFAANLGVAGRYLSPRKDWILGINVFYDYRDTKLFAGQQLGAGAELFFRKTVLRFNGYMPIGVVKRREDSRIRVALANLQGGIEASLLEWDHFILRGAVGVYYLAKRTFDDATFGKAWGTQIQLTSTIYQWIEAGIETTYDHIFNFTFQGYLALKIPLGNSRLHFPKNSFLQTLFQPIRRNEIIPIQKKHTKF